MYTYQHLPSSNHIRLVRLVSSRNQKHNLLELDILTTSIESTPDFEALSYVWGATTQTIPVLLGKEIHHVTQNLHAFLVQRLSDGAVLPLWIDALCINQSDDDEKSVQVNLMAKIYAHAARLTIWLGPASHNTEAAFKLIDNLSTNANWRLRGDDRDAVVEMLQCEWWSRVWVVQELANAGRARMNNDSTDLKYTIDVRCGKHSISWSDLSQAAREMLTEDLKYNHPRELASRILVLNNARCQLFPASDPDSKNGDDEKEGEDVDEDEDEDDISASQYYRDGPHKELELLTNIKLYRAWKSSDARDKIYGLLGLTSNFSVEWDDFKADYRKKGNPLFREVAKRAIVSSQKLDILSHCQGRCEQAQSSWAPDWTTPLSCVPLMPRDDIDREARITDYAQQIDRQLSFDAAASSTAQVSFLQNDTALSAGGYLVGRISNVSTIFHVQHESVYDYLPLCNQLGDFLHKLVNKSSTHPYGGVPGSKQAFWDAVFAGRVDVHRKLKLSMREMGCLEWLPRIPLTWKPQLPYAENFHATHLKEIKIWAYGKYDLGVSPFPSTPWDPFKQYRTHQNSDWKTISDRYYHGDRYLEGRRLFLTEDGYIGLGPPSMKAGDSVVILLGADVPFVLCSRSDDDNDFKLVGECYVSGVMQGEYLKEREAGLKQTQIFRII